APVVTLIFILAMGGEMAHAGVTATISGVVRDRSGAVIPGTQVIAKNRETGTAVTVLTDAQGFYSLQGLPVDTYDVEINKAGFKRSIQSGLVLSVNDVLKLDVVLELGRAEERVTVSLDALYAETTRSNRGGVASGEPL